MKSVSGKVLATALEQHGWELARINGSHYIYIKQGNFVRLSVPIHGNTSLQPGLLKALLKQASLTENDL